LPWAHVVTGPVTGPVVSEQATGCTHVVLDPPRRGLDKGALEALNANPSLRRVVSVSCDAATFARDLRLFLDAGWRLCDLRAFDVFEMTEHLETVSVMVRDR